jgi:hypothetical protein
MMVGHSLCPTYVFYSHSRGLAGWGPTLLLQTKLNALPTFKGGKLMPIVVGIDGTGADILPGQSRNSRYDAAFANSFVKRLSYGAWANKKYIRGPVLLGGGTLEAVVEGYNFILGRRRAGVKEPVLLTGYSRGAAGVVAIATRLQRQKVPVRAMLLFDCVDRAGDIDAAVIPDNVSYVLHVRRHPKSRSRESFGNDAKKFHFLTMYRQEFFHCTHGGMGGTPWIAPAGKSLNDFVDEGLPDGKTNVTYAQDAAVSAQVWSYVQPFISEYAFL